MFIDQIASVSYWNQYHPVFRTLFVICSFIAVLISKSSLFHLWLLLFVILLTFIASPVPYLVYVKILLFPFSFLLISSITLVTGIDFNSSQSAAMFYIFRMDSFSIFIPSYEKIIDIFIVITRSLSSSVILIFFSLTTTVNDVLYMLQKIRMPAIFIDLMKICYRSIFLLLDYGMDMTQAQKARLGYSSFFSAIKSAAHAASFIFIGMMKRDNEWQMSAAARLSDGSIYQIKRKFVFSMIHAFTLIFLAFFVLIASLLIAKDSYKLNIY